ncbi:hypothetical protein BDV40DRAFT_280053 [Aspergillus tamarii]|uniref:Uncharacterized protein n=1 Tax=Aspergillus tamarii TaxID=41984 RepID=A0A5N6UE31_ASPTM|nr:hypothetical protein BDV40DRAFT_280053 [Aspergillus tamarii]
MLNPTPSHTEHLHDNVHPASPAVGSLHSLLSLVANQEGAHCFDEVCFPKSRNC